jgi:hypothetical protein
VCADRGIPTIGQGARLAIAEPGDVVFIAAEGLFFCCPVDVSMEDVLGGGPYLSLKEQNCWFMICQTISSDDMVEDQQGFCDAREDLGVISKFWAVLEIFRGQKIDFNFWTFLAAEFPR